MVKDLSWDEFSRIDMRVGTVRKVNDFPEAIRPAYQLYIDFGEEIGTLKTSAQITKRYQKEDLIGMQLVAVVNFPNKQIANFMSECLVIGAVGEDNDISLLSPSLKTQNGLKVG